MLEGSLIILTVGWCAPPMLPYIGPKWCTRRRPHPSPARIHTSRRDLSIPHPQTSPRPPRKMPPSQSCKCLRTHPRALYTWAAMFPRLMAEMVRAASPSPFAGTDLHISTRSVHPAPSNMSSPTSNDDAFTPLKRPSSPPVYTGYVWSGGPAPYHPNGAHGDALTLRLWKDAPSTLWRVHLACL